MPVYFDFIIFFAASVIIFKSADLFTTGASGIARALRIPRFIIGLTIVSMATTLPEFTVSVFSSYMGSSGMAMGNAVGSCIANIGLVLGGAAVLGGFIHFQGTLVKQELRFLIASSLLLFVLAADSVLSRTDGAILSIVFVAALTYLIRRELKARRNRAHEAAVSDAALLKNTGKFLLGALGVVLAARYGIIPYGINIARFFKVPEVVIGLTLVAVATSLPELFTALVAAWKKMGDIAAGNVIGANIINVLWTLGVSGLVRPLEIDPQTVNATVPVMLILTLAIFFFCRSKSALTRREGIFLLVFYAGYLVYLLRFAY